MELAGRVVGATWKRPSGGGWPARLLSPPASSEGNEVVLHRNAAMKGERALALYHECPRCRRAGRADDGAARVERLEAPVLTETTVLRIDARGRLPHAERRGADLPVGAAFGVGRTVASTRGAAGRRDDDRGSRRGRAGLGRAGIAATACCMTSKLRGESVTTGRGVAVPARGGRGGGFVDVASAARWRPARGGRSGRSGAVGHHRRGLDRCVVRSWTSPRRMGRQRWGGGSAPARTRSEPAGRPEDGRRHASPGGRRIRTRRLRSVAHAVGSGGGAKRTGRQGYQHHR